MTETTTPNGMTKYRPVMDNNNNNNNNHNHNELPIQKMVTNRNFVSDLSVDDDALVGSADVEFSNNGATAIASSGETTNGHVDGLVTGEDECSLGDVPINVEGQDKARIAATNGVPTSEPGSVHENRAPGEFVSLHYDQTRVSTVSGSTPSISIGPRLSSTSSPGSRYSKRREAMPRRSSSLGHHQYCHAEESDYDSDQDYEAQTSRNATSSHHASPSALTGIGSQREGTGTLPSIGTRMESVLKRLLCCYLPQDDSISPKKKDPQFQRRKSARLRNSNRAGGRAIQDEKTANVDDDDIELTFQRNEHGNPDFHDPRPTSERTTGEAAHNTSEPITTIHNLITQVQKQSNLGKYNNRRSGMPPLPPRYANRLPQHQHYHANNLIVKQIPRNSTRRLSRNITTIPGTYFEDKYLLAPQPEQLQGRKTLVLDLDETLVHSSFRPVFGADFVIDVEIDRMLHKVYVCKRPGVDQFLEAVSEHYEIVVFTASLSKYADPVMDQLDPKGLISSRLFREACTFRGGNYIKDLRRLGRDLSQTIIIDNSPTCFSMQPENGLACTSWFDDPGCRELLQMIPLLAHVAQEPDIYETIDMYKRSTVTG